MTTAAVSLSMNARMSGIIQMAAKHDHSTFTLIRRSLITSDVEIQHIGQITNNSAASAVIIGGYGRHAWCLKKTTTHINQLKRGLGMNNKMSSERIKEIQQKTAYPESVSVQQALLQVWRECGSFRPQPAEIEKVMAEKFELQKIFDESGWTGEWRLSVKDVLDVIIDLQNKQDPLADCHTSNA